MEHNVWRHFIIPHVQYLRKDETKGMVLGEDGVGQILCGYKGRFLVW